MKVRTKHFNHREFEIALTYEDLKRIIADHLRNTTDLKASNGAAASIKVPMRPALKITFPNDAYSGVTAVVRWHESNH